jgi:hypothetical protein
MKKKNLIAKLIIIFIITFISCKKKKVDPHVPPDVVFKTGSKYISSDVILPKQDTIWVGINATKTEDNLKSYNVSYAYDGVATTTSFFNYLVSSSEYESYSKDIQIVTRNQAGTEKWVFSIVDRDGNITQKSILITVQ